MTKVYLYKNWIDTPEHPQRSFKTIGRACLELDVVGRQPGAIMQRVGNKARTTLAPKLILVKDSDGYENALIGDDKQIVNFLRDCLVDLGFMSIKWGKRI